MSYPNRLRRRQAARQQQESIDMDDYMQTSSEVSEEMIPPIDAPTVEDTVDMLDVRHSSPTEGHVGTSAEGALMNSDLPCHNVMLRTNPPHEVANIKDKGKSIVEDIDQEDAMLPIPIPVLVPAPPPVPPTSGKKKCNPYLPCEGCLKFFGSPVPGRLRIRGPMMDDDDHDQPPRQKTKQSRHGPVSKSSEFRGVTYYKRTGRWESHIWHGARQVYLGASKTKQEAARGYDKAALYLNGPVTGDMNFPRHNYQEEMLRLRDLTKNQLVIYLRRLSRGFATDAKYPCIKVVRNGYLAMYKPERKKRASMALGKFATEEDAARAVYNEALKRQNADLAGYLMDTHHVYSILPPSAARPPRGAAGPGEVHHAPEARDVDDDAPEGCDDDNLPSEVKKCQKTPNTEATDSKRRRVARPHPTAVDAPADHRPSDPAQPAAAPNPAGPPPPELTELRAPQPHDGRSPGVVQNCPRKSRSSRTYAPRPTNNTTMGAVTTPVMAAPIRRTYVDVPISASTPDLLPAPHQAAVPVHQAVLSPAPSLPQSNAMVRPVHPVHPLVQQYSVAARGGIAPGSKRSGFRSVVDRRAPAAQGAGLSENSRTPPAAPGASTPKPRNVGVNPKPKPVHPRPPRPHVARAGFTVTARVPLGASMQPASSVHQLAAPVEPTQRPPADPVHQSIAVNTVRRAASVAFETLTVPAWNVHSQDSNDEQPQLEVSTRPQAVIERNVGVIPTSTVSNPPLPCPQEAVVPAQPANESLREPVSYTASQASELQITLPAARRPPIDEYSLHQSIADTVRRSSAALQIIIPVRHAQNLNVERPQMESLTPPQPVIGRNVGDKNPTSMANTQLSSPSHEALPSQPHNSFHQSLLPASTAAQAASSGMPSSRPAPRRRQPIKVKRHPRPLAPKCRAGGGSRVQPSLPPPHSRPPAVSTQLEPWTSPRDAQRNVGTVPMSTHVTPPPPPLQTSSVHFPEPIVAPFRPYARQNTPDPVQHAYSSVQQPAPLDSSFDASGSGGQISSPRPSPPAEYNSEWQPVRPAILDIQSSTDQPAGDIHRQGYIVPGQSVVPHVGTISPEMITAPGDSSYSSEGRRAVQELAAAAAAISCDGGRAHHEHWFINFQRLQAHYNYWPPNPLYTQATRPTPMRQLVPPPSVEFNGNFGHHPTVSPETMGIPLHPTPTRGFQPNGMRRFIPPAEVHPPQFTVMDWDSVEEIHATTTGLSLALIPDQTLTPRDELETPVNLQNDLPITELQLAAPSIAGNTQGADDNVDIATADRSTWLSL